MNNGLFQIRFGKALLVLTPEEFLRVLRRGCLGCTVKKNQRAAKERRQAGGHAHGLRKTMA